MTPNRLPLLAVAGLLCNAFIWGVSWWPFRELQARGLHALWATVVVYTAATLIIVALNRRSLREAWTHGSIWALAAAAGMVNVCFNWAITIGDIVRLILLFYVMPLWAVLLARWLLHEPITRNAMLRIALALVGAVVVLWPEGAGLGAGLPVPHSLADFLALAGGFFFALTNVLLRRHAHRSEGARAIGMFIGGAVLALAAALGLGAAGVVPVPSPPAAWAWLAAGLTVAFIISNLSLQYGAARLPASATAVIMLTEIVFASGSAVLLGAETLSGQDLLGGALIMAAAALAALQAAPEAAPDTTTRPKEPT